MGSRWVALGSGLLLLSACTDLTGPDRGDPSQYVLAAPARFACGFWVPAAPSVQLGLFDVYFTSAVTPPTPAQVRTVVRAGGTIVRRFQVNGVRAVLPIQALGRFTASAVQGVLEATVLEHQVDVGFTVDGKGGLLLAQGGRVLWMSSTFPDFFAVLPDAAVPAIRRDPGLRHFSVSLVTCPEF